MKDFAAIDFETANGRRTSVCSVGVVVVRGGEVVDTLYSLIRPRPNFYSRFTTAIHGLSYEDTAQAPDFADVWKQIAPRIEGLPLVAHNSPFDEGCLRAVFELYGMPYPGYRFYCTCRASRRTFGSSLPNHQLHTVSAACGFDCTGVPVPKQKLPATAGSFRIFLLPGQSPSSSWKRISQRL